MMRLLNQMKTNKPAVFEPFDLKKYVYPEYRKV